MATARTARSRATAIDLSFLEQPAKKPTNVDANTKKQVLDALAALGQQAIGEDSLRFEGTQMVLPASMNGDIKAAIKYLTEYENQQNTTFEFSRMFNYRPWDGANAFQSAMFKLFGTTGVGKAIPGGLFSPDIPPQYIDINVSPTETVQVPWGRVYFSPLEADFYLGHGRHQDYGMIFSVSVTAPRKYRAHIEAFFAMVEKELQENSIYRGKAFTGCKEEGMPTFIDTSTVDPATVVYSEEVMRQLDTNLWCLIRYTDEMRRLKIPRKRAVLVEGPYGTGKTLAGMLTAQVAVQNGWTFILARPGDDLNGVLQTAQLYAPAVVWYEDMDVVAQGRSDLQLSKLLDSLDGITNKGTELLAGFTTNHVQKIQMGALRCGRIDAIIHVGGLDGEGFEKLIKVTIPPAMLGEVDYAKVTAAFEGFLPAFAKEAITRAISYSISRNNGKAAPITTDDLVDSANALRPHLELMLKAQEGTPPVSQLDAQIRRIVDSSINGTKFVDMAGNNTYYKLQVGR